MWCYPFSMPEPILSEDERVELHLAATRKADRDRLWDMLLTGAQCVAWCALALFLLGWSFHTDDEKLGRVFFWGGILVGNGGIVFTLARAYQRGEQRGDW
jgi:hypothetical protein